MKAVFLDRDGVIIRKAPENEYIARWEDVAFFSGALHAIAKLYCAGFKIFLVTNQRGIALGRVDLRDLDEIHDRMRAKLGELHARISGIYFCPHAKHEHCSCRKPQLGMLLQAAEEHGLDLRHCWLIGDAPSDIEAGIRAGCRTARIGPLNYEASTFPAPDLVAADLSSAADQILRRVPEITLPHHALIR